MGTADVNSACKASVEQQPADLANYGSLMIDQPLPGPVDCLDILCPPSATMRQLEVFHSRKILDHRSPSRSEDEPEIPARVIG